MGFLLCLLTIGPPDPQCLKQRWTVQISQMGPWEWWYKRTAPFHSLVPKLLYFTFPVKFHIMFVIWDVYSILGDGANLTSYPLQDGASDASLGSCFTSLPDWCLKGIQHEIGPMDPMGMCHCCTPLLQSKSLRGPERIQLMMGSMSWKTPWCLVVMCFLSTMAQ